jgi:hypothetical protein
MTTVAPFEPYCGAETPRDLSSLIASCCVFQIYIGVRLTVTQQIYSLLMFYNLTFYSCYMFRSYKTIIRQLYIGIRLVTELPI